MAPKVIAKFNPNPVIIGRINDNTNIKFLAKRIIISFTKKN